MSMRKGGGPKQGPRHQNTFEFRHNPKSKKTKFIMGIGNATQDLCPRCSAIIEWRRKCVLLCCVSSIVVCSPTLSNPLTVYGACVLALCQVPKVQTVEGSEKVVRVCPP